MIENDRSLASDALGSGCKCGLTGCMCSVSRSVRGCRDSAWESGRAYRELPVGRHLGERTRFRSRSGALSVEGHASKLEYVDG